MFPTTDQDFLRIAGQRLEVSRALLKIEYTLDAQYLSGYVVECSIKAVILRHAPSHEQKNIIQKITSGAAMHKSEILLGVLRDLGITIDGELAKRHRRFMKTWSTSLRYEVGKRDRGETRGMLKTAAAFFKWAAGESS